MLLEVIIDNGSAFVTYGKITETKSSRKLRVSLYLRRFTKVHEHVTKVTRRLTLMVCTAMSQSQLNLALTSKIALLSFHFTSQCKELIANM